MPKSLRILQLALFITLALSCFSFSQTDERITITTYYPSPFGSYDQLGVNKLAVDVSGVAVSSEFAAMQNGDAHIGRSLIIGAGNGSGFAYDEFTVGVTDPRPEDGELLVKSSVGIGVTAPSAILEVQGLEASGGDALGDHKLFLVRGHSGTPWTTDSGAAWIQYGPNAAPWLVLEDGDDPPRIRFQQTGTGNETAPQFASWIGHSQQSTSDISIMNGNVGIGTTNPEQTLVIDSGGTSATPVSAIRIIDGNQQQGRVLTSDEIGVGTWGEGGTWVTVKEVDLSSASSYTFDNTVEPGLIDGDRQMVYKIIFQGSFSHSGSPDGNVGIRLNGSSASNNDYLSYRYGDCVDEGANQPTGSVNMDITSFYVARTMWYDSLPTLSFEYTIYAMKGRMRTGYGTAALLTGHSEHPFAACRNELWGSWRVSTTSNITSIWVGTSSGTLSGKLTLLALHR